MNMEFHMENLLDEYNSGISISKLCKKYKKGHVTLRNELVAQGATIRNKHDAILLENKLNPRKLSEDTKQKISKARKKYLSENPDKVPYLLNHSSRNSYPAKRFRRILKDINICGWIEEYQFSRYSFDFAFPDIKLDVEIDGGTHKLPEVIAKDKERDEYSKSQGWTVLRIEAGMVNNNARGAIELLMDAIKELSGECVLYDNKRWEELKIQLLIRKTLGHEKVCPNCNSKFHTYATRQECCGRSCATKYSYKTSPTRKRKVERPSALQLISEIESSGYSATGRNYGVSDNTIRKWLRAYDVDPKAIKKK